MRCVLVRSQSSAPAAAGDAAEPLHARTDQFVEQANGPVMALPLGDAEFLRRVSLDVTGVPPAPE